MAKSDIKLEKRICRECGQEYDAKIGFILGKSFDFSRGYCDTCWDKKVKEEEKREEAARLLKIASKRRDWRENCGIPHKFMTEQFGTFEQKRQQQTYDKCFEYAEGYPLVDSRGYKSLILYSERSWGVGKTHLACSIAHHILNRWGGEDVGRPVYCISEYAIYEQIQETYNYSLEEQHYRESAADIIRRLVCVPLLIIDDVGKEKRSKSKSGQVVSSEFVQRTLFKIIDGRYKNCRPIVMTANLSPAKLKSYLGGAGDDASFDRLWEMAGGEFIRIEGESYRRR